MFVCHSNSDEILDLLAPDWRTVTAKLGGGTRAFGGTSASAPLVAGMAALLKQASPDATPDILRECLIRTAGDYGEPGSDNIYGYGLADVWEAYQYLRTHY